MIELITGKPGAGKGLYSVKLVLDELSQGKRPIITNLAVKLDPWVNGAGIPQMGMRAYLKAKYGSTFNVDKRVLRISDDEAAEFFRFRVNKDGERVECAARWGKDQTDKRGKPNEFDTEAAVEAGGALYLLDECWKFWGSRNWKDTGATLLFYNAQHRKLGDDVLMATQHCKQLDTAIRQVAQNFQVVRNHSMERFGWFRQPDVFTVATFGDIPGPSVMRQCMATFKLDARGIGGCYDTSAGVGVVGQGAADVGRRKKGLNMLYVVPCVVVAAAIVIAVPHYASKGFFSTMKGSKPKVAKQSAEPATKYHTCGAYRPLA